MGFLDFFRKKPEAATRAFEGATGSYRYPRSAEMPNALSALAAARGPLSRRARYMVANNALAASATEAWVSNLIGYGIQASSAHADRDMRETINAAFGRFVDYIDADGDGDFYALQAIMVRQMITDGESFAVMRNTAAGLRMRVIDPDQVDASVTRPAAGGGYVVQGIEFDAKGNKVAYWIRDTNPALPFGYDLTPRPIPAADVIHLFHKTLPGQVRGVSWFSPVLLRLHNVEIWADAQLTRQQIAALMGVFVKGGKGDGTPFDSDLATKGLSPGAIRYLDSDEDVTVMPAANVGQEVIAFLEVMERHIAVGLSLPAFVLSGDLTKANYGSQRGGLQEWRRRIEKLQHSVIAFQMLRPVWERWIITEVLAGRIDSTIDAALPVNWVPPRLDWIDPLKDAQAEREAVDAGFKSRREVIASRGGNIEDVDRQNAEDNQRAKDLGLDYSQRPPANDNPPPEQSQAA